MKRFVLAGVFLQLAILFIGLTWIAPLARDDGGGAAGATGGSGSTEEASAAAGPIAVALRDFAIEPEVIIAAAGQALAFEVTNGGESPHTFGVVAGSKTYETDQIDPGASATLQVPALEAGSYKTLCTVPGHEDLGMVGMLMVEEGAGGASANGGATTQTSLTAQQMADMHREGVEAFPAETRGAGNQVLEPEIQDGVKIFSLTAEELRWEVAPGEFKEAMAYNGQVPGPEIRVQPGDRVRVLLQNRTSQPTSIHFHGVTVPNDMDGVPYITQDPVMPGGAFEYEFTVKDVPGTHVYHSHFNSTEQVGRGLFGAFIIEPRGKPNWDREFTLFTDDGPLGFGLNGKSFPATAPFVAERGETVLIRLANDGALAHPMHLHGFHFEVVAEDGFPLASPYMADTLEISPGQRFDVLVEANNPGVWAFHCHILPHVEGPEGMFGMVTALVVE